MGSDPHGDELGAFRAAIAERCQWHVDAFLAGNADALVEGFFTEDAVWTGPGFPDARGHEQLKAMFAGVVGKQTVSFNSEYSSVYGDVGWNIATYPVTPHDSDAAPFTFRPLFVWVRRGDEWRCAAVCSFLK